MKEDTLNFSVSLFPLLWPLFLILDYVYIEMQLIAAVTRFNAGVPGGGRIRHDESRVPSVYYTVHTIPRCKFSPYMTSVWSMTSSALPVTFTAATLGTLDRLYPTLADTPHRR